MEKESKLNMHSKILIVLGVTFAALNFINPAAFFSAESEPTKNSQNTTKTKIVSVTDVKPVYTNPNLTWYERHFCRGYSSSRFCSKKLRHPAANEINSYTRAQPKEVGSERIIAHTLKR